MINLRVTATEEMQGEHSPPRQDVTGGRTLQ